MPTIVASEHPIGGNKDTSTSKQTVGLRLSAYTRHAMTR